MGHVGEEAVLDNDESQKRRERGKEKANEEAGDRKGREKGRNRGEVERMHSLCVSA